MAISKSFKEWISLKLPYELITNLSQDLKNTIQLIFNQIDIVTDQLNKSNFYHDEILQASSETIIELIKLSKKKSKFNQLNQYLTEKVFEIGKNLDHILQ